MHAFIVLLLTVVLAAPADAQVQIDIGIHLPAPPQLVVIPEVREVKYAPTATANLFVYDDQYWAFVNGGWHVSARFNGPWIVISPVFVPRPVLLVPVAYYRVPPGHWKQWHRNAPPRWGHEWGREWSAKREWKDRDDDHGKGHAKDDDRGKGAAKDDDRGKKSGKGESPGRGKGR